MIIFQLYCTENLLRNSYLSYNSTITELKKLSISSMILWLRKLILCNLLNNKYKLLKYMYIFINIYFFNKTINIIFVYLLRMNFLRNKKKKFISITCIWMRCQTKAILTI